VGCKVFGEGVRSPVAVDCLCLLRMEVEGLGNLTYFNF
jgi:hypothetical protein